MSNYTQTLDLIGRMCNENNWGFCRLDGSIGMKKRQKMVDEFNNPSSKVRSGDLFRSSLSLSRR